MVITILRSPIAGGVTTVASEHDSNNIPIERASQSTTTFPPPLCREPFCAELHTRAVNVTLLAFARAERRAAPCSNRSISPARRAHSSKPAAAAECGGSMMGQTRVVHGSILCDPIQPNPWVNPTHGQLWGVLRGQMSFIRSAHLRVGWQQQITSSRSETCCR